MGPWFRSSAIDSLAKQLEVREINRRFEAIISIANRHLNDHDEEKKIQEVEARVAESGKGFKKKDAHLVAKALGIKSDASIIGGGTGNFFYCNICLNLATDPVLTRCGHLFCWSCLRQLAYVYSYARECPVCDGEVIETEIIPIYGSSSTIANREPRSKRSGLRIPPRPAAPRTKNFRLRTIYPRESSAVIRRFQRVNDLNGGSGVQVQSQNPNAATDRNINGLLTQSHLDTTYDHGTGSSPISMFLVPGAASISSPDSPSRMDTDTTADIGSEIQTTDTNMHTD